MPMLRFLLFLFAGLWIIPRLLRSLGGRSGNPDGRSETRTSGDRPTPESSNDPRLSDLTQQDISDADFEEISEEE